MSTGKVVILIAETSSYPSIMLNETWIAQLDQHLHGGRGQANAKFKGTLFLWNTNVHLIPPSSNALHRYPWQALAWFPGGITKFFPDAPG